MTFRVVHQPCSGEPDVKLSRHVPVDHPLALQFQRAVESLTAAQVCISITRPLSSPEPANSTRPNNGQRLAG
jgi:hypothetical protein